MSFGIRAFVVWPMHYSCPVFLFVISVVRVTAFFEYEYKIREACGTYIIIVC